MEETSLKQARPMPQKRPERRLFRRTRLSLEFCWAHSGAYATRDGNGKITVFQDTSAALLHTVSINAGWR